MTTKTIGQLPATSLVPAEALVEVEVNGGSRKLSVNDLRTVILAGFVAHDIDPSVGHEIDAIRQNIAQIEDAMGSAVSAAESATSSEGARLAAMAARGAAETMAMTAQTARDVAEAARNDAKEARDAAAGAEAQAIENANAAAQSAQSADGFARTASGAATTATQKADEAGEKASIASASAQTASTKAGEATTSASNAATSEANALGYKNSAYQSQQVAATAAGDAGGAANAAAISAQSASTSKTAAETSASSAQTSATNASTKAGEASTSAQSASTSASNASGSAQQAVISQQAAASSAGLASGSAQAASTSAQTASTKAGEAGNSAQAANQSKLDAQAANTGAQTQAQAAQASAVSAGDSAAAASSSATLSSVFSGTRGLTPNGMFDVAAGWSSSGNMTYGNWFRGKGFRVVGAYGSTQSTTRIAIDPSRKYRMTLGVVVHGDGTKQSRVYGGFACFDASGNNLGNVYMPSTGPKMVSGQVYTKTDEFTGTYTPSIAGPWFTYTNTFYPGTVAIQPLALLNYPDPTPITEPHDIFCLYIEDITQEKLAKAQADAANTSATAASDNAASARQSAALSASLASGALNKNATFADYATPAPIPPNWTSWTGSGGRTYGNGDGAVGGLSIEGSPWGFYQAAAANAEGSGIYQDIGSPAGTYVVSATVQLRSGNSLNGAGVLIYAYDSGGAWLGQALLPFQSEKDSSGNVWSGVLTPGTRVYRWSKAITFTDARVSTIRIYAMTNWSGFTSDTRAKALSWLRASISAGADANVALAAVAAEHAAWVDGDTALSNSIVGVKSRVGDLESAASITTTALTDLNNKTAARIKLESVAGTGRAQLSVWADANGGGGVDIVGDTTFKGKLDIGSGASGEHLELTNQHLRIYYSNGIPAIEAGTDL